MGSYVKHIISELRNEHDALASAIRELADSELERPSYAADWTVAQVLSHLGSASEINVSNIRAALHGTERVAEDAYPELWSRWDSATPAEQAKGFERAHGELVASLESIQEDRLKDLEIDTAMGTLSVEEIAKMRLREASVHAWDIAVVVDRGATIRDGAVPLLVDQLSGMMGRAAETSVARSLEINEVHIAASDPDRSFVLSLTDPVTLQDGTATPTSHVLRLSSEALVRLVYGRLDPEHVPKETEEEPLGLLDGLRKVFRGF